MAEPGAPPIFGRSVNPIPIGEQIFPTNITIGTPKFFNLPSLFFQILPREVKGGNIQK